MLKATDAAFIRLKVEQDELKSRITKLEAFVRAIRRGELNVNDLEITHSELQLLEEQLHYMRGYLRVLNARITRVEENNHV